MTSYKHLTLSELLTYAQSDWSTPLEKALLDACFKLQEEYEFAKNDDNNDSYDRGYEDGREEGYHDGYDVGYDAGKSSHEQD